MQRPTSFSQANKILTKEGFTYLGRTIILDCFHYYWIKADNGSITIAYTDGWGETTPQENGRSTQKSSKNY